MMSAVAFLLIVTTTSTSEVTESVLFHPIDQIHTTISSWILTTAIDFLPYHFALDRVYHYTHNVKNSPLPLGGLFNFLFGTADQKDIDLLKQEVKVLYEYQVDQEKILNDIISVTNISRGVINKNIMKIMFSPEEAML